MRRRLLFTIVALRRVDRSISHLVARRSAYTVIAGKVTDDNLQFVLMAQWSVCDCSLDAVCSTLKPVSLSFTICKPLPGAHQQAAEQLQFRLLH